MTFFQLKRLKCIYYNPKEIFYRMIYYWYMSSEKLLRMYKDISNLCCKCEQHKGTFYHVWYHVWTCKKNYNILDSNKCMNCCKTLAGKRLSEVRSKGQRLEGGEWEREMLFCVHMIRKYFNSLWVSYIWNVSSNTLQYPLRQNLLTVWYILVPFNMS